MSTTRIHDEAPEGAFFHGHAEPRQGGVRIVGAKGGKGGGSVRQPVESPDSLHSTAYAKVLDLVSEGPIVGPVHGLTGLLRDVYLEGTPIQNADGSLNFQGVQADFRAGTQAQDYIPGFPSAESTVAVGVELRASQPWVRLISNTDLSAVRLTLEVRGLRQQSTSTGDVSGYRVDYVIELQTDGGAWANVLTGAFDGKTTSVYARSHRIDLPPAASGWNVRVRRTTPNSDSSTIVDATFVQSITEIIDAKLRYPMSSLVGLQVDASQFQNVPARGFHFRGRILSVPSNYEPESRSYSGAWDGTLKQAYTNNPAWVFYDMAASDRYGVRQRIGAARLSMLKWALYPIAQYCDELVPDGFGGQEPRFTCNAYLQQEGDAYRVMSDLASVFRGMAYETSGSVMAAADMPGDPTYTYSSANVIDGRFSYTGSALRTRYTVAQVSWNDLSDQGRGKVEVVEDREAQARYGLRIVQVSAFGCTSRGQAVRAAKWRLLTSQVETQGVTFRVGLDQALVMPGKVIRVVDPHRAGRRIGGRIRMASTTVIEVDAEVGVRPGDRLVVNLPSGISESREISSAVGEFIHADQTVWTVDSTEITADMVGLPGATLTITVTRPFSELPEPEAVWTVESEALSSQLYRVMSVSRQDAMTAQISAVQHEPGKFSSVDYGTKLDPVPITVVPPGVQPPPRDIVLSSYSVVDQGIARHVAQIRWAPPESQAISYQVQWRRDRSDWVEAGRTGSSSMELQDIRAGGYVVRVRAMNAMGVPSIWAYSAETQLQGDLAPPLALAYLNPTSLVFGVRLDWGFPVGPSIIERTELWYGQVDDLQQAIKLGDFAYPQSTHTLMGLAAGAQFFFWGRLVDKNGEIGPWHPVSGGGVMGQASSDAGEILEYLQGQITETQLAQALIEKIDSGGESAVVVEQLVNQLAAMYTIKTQITDGGRTYLAGIGVGVENNEGTIESQVLVAADRFAVIHPNGTTTTSPFVIQGGQAFMNQAFIADGTITNAKIGQVIQSNNYIAGQQGWRIDKAGGFELNGSVAGQGRVSISNQLLRVYDGNGVERVRLGIWS
ncbi:Phage tail fiber protein [plant metagenome]|uniref:Phage tail fiber protein n=1 Tax=plant metagenome TaxID=1297885 RepID=A0A484USB0_9ZZZZ